MEFAVWTSVLVREGYRGFARKWNPTSAAIRTPAAAETEITNRRTFPFALLRGGGEGGSGLKFLK